MVLLLGYSAFSQSQYDVVAFDYDTAGNQVVRELICLTCDDPMGRAALNPDTITPKDFIKSTEYNDISFYPNPVKEDLYIHWSNNQGNSVNSIEVNSISGQYVQSVQKLSKTDNATVSFRGLSEGIYNVTLLYSNGEKKVLKVVKK